MEWNGRTKTNDARNKSTEYHKAKGRRQKNNHLILNDRKKAIGRRRRSKEHLNRPMKQKRDAMEGEENARGAAREKRERKIYDGFTHVSTANTTQTGKVEQRKMENRQKLATGIAERNPFLVLVDGPWSNSSAQLQICFCCAYFLLDRVLDSQSRPSYKPSPVGALLPWINH